jgi:hypothetical protein
MHGSEAKLQRSSNFLVVPPKSSDYGTGKGVTRRFLWPPSGRHRFKDLYSPNPE